MMLQNSLIAVLSFGVAMLPFQITPKLDFWLVLLLLLLLSNYDRIYHYRLSNVYSKSIITERIDGRGKRGSRLRVGGFNPGV